MPHGEEKAVNGDSSVVRFGVFELDLETGELRKRGVLVHLPHQPVKVLALLASQPGKLFTREEIRERIWSEGTFVDLDQSLNQCIKQIRAGLGDEADTPRYIETLPRRGYRFIAPVENGAGPAVERAPGSAKPEPRLSHIPRSWYAGAAGIVLASALAGFAVSHLIPGWSKAAAGSASRVTRVTTDPTSIWPAVSPDGKLLAYVARRDSPDFSIWVQHAGGGAAVRVTEGVSAGGHIVFSADGSKIYYPSASDPPGTYEVPVLGGESRLLIAGARHIQPSPDGKWLAYARDYTVYVQPAVAGEARELTRDYWGYYWKSCIVWSTDSTRLLVALRHGDQPRGGQPREDQTLAVFSLEGSKSEPRYALGENLRKRGFNTSNLRLVAWLPDGDIVFAARYGDATNLWRIPLANAGEAEPSPVTIGPWSAQMADLRGGRLVFANLRHTDQVWRLRADVNAGRVFGEPERVTPELVDAQFPDVRRDGSALTYVALKGGRQGVVFLDLRTGKEHSLVLGERDAAYSTFSPDGSRVAFMLPRPGPGWPWPAFVVPVAGGEPKFIGGAGGRIRGWSRDGRFLLIWRRGGDPRTTGVLDLADGHVTDIIKSDFPIDGARFSPDCRWVAFLSSEEDPKPRLWIAPFRGAQPVPPADWIEIAGGGTLPFRSPDGRSFYYARANDGSPTEVVLFRQPLDNAGKPSGSPKAFYSIRGHTVGGLLLNTISTTKDYVYFLLEDGQSDIWMMDVPQ